MSIAFFSQSGRPLSAPLSFSGLCDAVIITPTFQPTTARFFTTTVAGFGSPLKTWPQNKKKWLSFFFSGLWLFFFFLLKLNFGYSANVDDWERLHVQRKPVSIPIIWWAISVDHRTRSPGLNTTRKWFPNTVVMQFLSMIPWTCSLRGQKASCSDPTRKTCHNSQQLQNPD